MEKYQQNIIFTPSIRNKRAKNIILDLPPIPKCENCKCVLNMSADRMYLVAPAAPTGLAALGAQPIELREAYDCEHCGAQNLRGTRLKRADSQKARKIPYFPTKEAAEEALQKLRNILSLYDFVELADYVELTGVPSMYEETRQVWMNLNDAEVRRKNDHEWFVHAPGLLEIAAAQQRLFEQGQNDVKEEEDQPCETPYLIDLNEYHRGHREYEKVKLIYDSTDDTLCACGGTDTPCPVYALIDGWKDIFTQQNRPHSIAIRNDTTKRDVKIELANFPKRVEPTKLIDGPHKYLVFDIQGETETPAARASAMTSLRWFEKDGVLVEVWPQKGCGDGDERTVYTDIYEDGQRRYRIVASAASYSKAVTELRHKYNTFKKQG